MTVIDGDGAVLGRLSAKVAKRLLGGEDVIVVNADKVLITGNPDFVKRKYRDIFAIGSPIHGPFFKKRADMIVRRSIKGMLPHQKTKGRIALKKLRVYKDKPTEVTGEVVSMRKELRTRSITVGELAKSLGAK